MSVEPYESEKQGIASYISFESKKGKLFMLPYSLLMSLTLEDPEEGVDDVLSFSFATHAVTLRGANLAEIYYQVRKCKCALIREISASGKDFSKKPCVVKMQIAVVE